MAVRIRLDSSSAFYTNLDIISGSVSLSLPREETISAITVKLEGESSTTLIRPPPLQSQHGRSRGGESDTINENHKILYHVVQVFPPAGTTPTTLTSGLGGMGSLGAALTPLGGGSSYTLGAGQHEYPFSFKIPFNNMCLNQPPQMKVELGSFFSRDLTQPIRMRHIKTTLPPSLSGLPGEAEIRYFVKVTVQRPSLLKENHRAQVTFRFQPIEPPRPASIMAEAFARRSHTFPPSLSLPQRSSMSFFSSSKSKPQETLSSISPQILVDARLPSPAILTRNSLVPLKILLTKQNNSADTVFLVGLDINLLGTTQVRAGEVQRTEHHVWSLVALARLSEPIMWETVGSETWLDAKLWKHAKLPEDITPSFNICNLTRTYELEIKITIGVGRMPSLFIHVCLSNHYHFTIADDHNLAVRSDYSPSISSPSIFRHSTIPSHPSCHGFEISRPQHHIDTNAKPNLSTTSKRNPATVASSTPCSFDIDIWCITRERSIISTTIVRPWRYR